MTHPLSSHDRRGITLMEVLISMGILTVGLASVAALIPAGRSQAIKAAIYDRGSTLASNAAAELITRGFLRTEELVPAPSLANTRILVFDPLFAGTWGPTGAFVGLRDDAATSASSLKELSVNARGGATTGIPSAVADILFRSEDDPIYGVPDNDPDIPPMPGWSNDGTGNGRRGFEGNYSYLATLETGEVNPPYWLSGRQALLTVVVFHRRDPSTSPFELAAAADGSGLWIDPDPTGSPVVLPDGDTIRDVVKPGSMVLWADHPTTPTRYHWYRTLIVMDQTTTADGVRMGISFEGSDPPGLSNDERLYVLPGSISGVQVPVSLEGSSEWSE